jgi:uncharacterized membrane protein YphA (DoxX/SURF4 family)
MSANTTQDSSKGMTTAVWLAQLAVAGILGMGAFMKFFNYTPEGSMALADAMGVGRGAIAMIGVVETAALVLILIPRTHAIGALLAVFTMLGALLAHATKIGWSGNAAAEGWPLALVVLVAASFVLMVRRKELPIVGEKL